MTGSSQALTTVSPYADVGFSHTFVMPGGLAVTPDVLLGYRYNSGAQGQNVTLVAADGTNFSGERVGLRKSTGLLGASLTATQGGWSAYVKYRADFAQGWTDQSLSLGMRLAF